VPCAPCRAQPPAAEPPVDPAKAAAERKSVPAPVPKKEKNDEGVDALLALAGAASTTAPGVVEEKKGVTKRQRAVREPAKISAPTAAPATKKPKASFKKVDVPTMKGVSRDWGRTAAIVRHCIRAVFFPREAPRRAMKTDTVCAQSRGPATVASIRLRGQG
jgi:hypothetical protein